MTNDSVETRSSVILCELIVHLLVGVQNKKKRSLYTSDIYSQMMGTM